MALSTNGSGSRAYSTSARWLHWGTLALLVVQALLGLLHVFGEDDHSAGAPGHRHGHEHADALFTQGNLALSLHVLIGLSIVVLVLIRLGWRLDHGLPAWAESLSPTERRATTLNERMMYAALLATAFSGLAVLRDDDWAWLHLSAQLALASTLIIHVWMVVRHRLLARML